MWYCVGAKEPNVVSFQIENSYIGLKLNNKDMPDVRFDSYVNLMALVEKLYLFFIFNWRLL